MLCTLWLSLLFTPGFTKTILQETWDEFRRGVRSLKDIRLRYGLDMEEIRRRYGGTDLCTMVPAYKQLSFEEYLLAGNHFREDDGCKPVGNKERYWH